MPRKRLYYTDQFPYHVYARSNNREWFYLPKPEVWEIFSEHLHELTTKFGCIFHAFVLMDNHYHLLITTSERYLLGHVMQELQKSVARKINGRTGRINHVFGGPYRASLIRDEVGYAQVFKYIYRNPIEAGICRSPSQYPFSTFRNDAIPVCSPNTGIAALVPSRSLGDWIEEAESDDVTDAIRKGLSKTEYAAAYKRKY